jgi:predicted dehydrogenase
VIAVKPRAATSDSPRRAGGDVRVAIVGSGAIAKQHLAALAQAPGACVVGVCDLSSVMAEATASRFHVPAFFSNFGEMVRATAPHVVHVTTPPASHAPLALESLAAGAHVFVEKPIACDYATFGQLAAAARDANRWLVEDYNYVFNREVQQMLHLVESGQLGAVRHVDVQLSLDLFGAGSRFADLDLPHPAMKEPLGACEDFVTHLCSLAHAFVGRHRSASTCWRTERPDLMDRPTESHALIDGERGTASLSFSGTAQPDAFSLRVQGTKMRVETNLFDAGLVTTRIMGGPKPLASIRNARARGRDERRNARRSLARKLSGGPGSYEGLWTLIGRFYAALAANEPPPISLPAMDDVNRLVEDLRHSAALSCAS